MPRMRQRETALLASVLALQIVTAGSRAESFAFFQPSVTITAEDRHQLDKGEPIARVLPGEGQEVAIFAAVPVRVDGDRLIAWIRRIEELKKSTYVPQIQRFSDPPRIEDLAGLTLDDKELSEIRECRPGRCNLKLSAAEMKELQRAAADGGSEWRDALQNRLRQIVLDRVTGYLSGVPVGPYEDHRDPVWPAREFGVLVKHSAFLTEHLPAFAEDLQAAPGSSSPDVESFVYWAQQRIGNRPVLSVTHVKIVRSQNPPLPDVLVAGKDVFSTHYINASLGLTALMRGAPGGPNYLVYVNRSEVDALRGVFGPVIRWFVQRRLKAEAADVLQGLRRRLEGGEPPPRVAGSG